MSRDTELESERGLTTGSIAGMIQTIRGKSVILDSDLAALYGTETKKLNQQVKRNLERFPETFAFRLSEDEFRALKSQDVTAGPRHGGRRIPPIAFTEHGVAMAATVLTSPRATAVLQLIIDVFVDTRRQMLSGAAGDRGLARHRQRIEAMYDALARYSQTMLDFEINKRDSMTVKDEVEQLTVSVLDAVKAQLAEKQVKNESIIAEIQRKMAETDKLRAETRKTHAEADTIEIANWRERLELLREMVKTLEEASPFLPMNAMDQLGRALPPADRKSLPRKDR